MDVKVFNTVSFISNHISGKHQANNSYVTTLRKRGKYGNSSRLEMTYGFDPFG